MGKKKAGQKPQKGGGGKGKTAMKGHPNSMKPKPQQHQQKSQQQRSPQPPTSSSSAGKSSSQSKLSDLQQQFAKKLESARFRSINEELYTSPGNVSFEEFQREPSKFHTYHKGYREAALSWPINPLDSLIRWIQSRHPSAVVADLGCGEARLAASVSNTVHSFDLVAANPTVTACDMAALPLPDSSVDIAIFCLSLMGTNIADFLKEAHRILKPNGILKIVEVRSRLEDGKGIKRFIQFLKACGFRMASEEADEFLDNRMFFSVEAFKTSQPGNFTANFELKPCQYKKR